MKTVLLLLCLLPAALTHAQTGKQTAKDSTCFPRAFIQPGQCSSRQLGDLLVGYAPDSSGTVVTCILLLATQPVGVCTLTAANNTYQFDVKLGTSSSRGTITLNLAVTAWYVRTINP